MSSIFFFLFFFFLLLFKIRAVLFFFSPFLFTIRALFVLKCPKVPRITRELPQSAPACAPSPKAPSLHARSPRGWGASAAWASRALITIRSGYGASRLGISRDLRTAALQPGHWESEHIPRSHVRLPRPSTRRTSSGVSAGDSPARPCQCPRR